MVANYLESSYDAHMRKIDRPKLEKIERELIGNRKLLEEFLRLRTSLYKGADITPRLIIGPPQRNPRTALKIIAEVFDIDFVVVEKQEDPKASPVNGKVR